MDELLTSLPEVNKVKCNAKNCELVGFDPNGLGQGRLFNDDEQKCENIGQITQDANTCATPEDKMRYYGPKDDMKGQLARHTVPGGALMMEGGDSRVSN